MKELAKQLVTIVNDTSNDYEAEEQILEILNDFETHKLFCNFVEDPTNYKSSEKDGETRRLAEWA